MVDQTSQAPNSHYLKLLSALTPQPSPPQHSALSALASLFATPPPLRKKTIWEELAEYGQSVQPPADPSWLQDIGQDTGHSAIARALLAGSPAPRVPQPSPIHSALIAAALLQPSVPVPAPVSGSAPAKRHVFFSFHYEDVIRVNNIRHSEQFKAKLNEVPQSFYDRSLWETRQLTSPEALKRMIREGVMNSSVICVLIGTRTWSRRWVRYEIARALIDGKGLVGVHLNGITHHKTLSSHPLGYNPFATMGVARTWDGYRIAEVNDAGVWQLYGDHTRTIDLPPYLSAPPNINDVVPFAQAAPIFDWASQNGSNAMPHWMDHAAKLAGR